mmetsp:Transcript_54742/g.122455  ORF Transcript_54742/g.122455 Transcript_54742/m.122455 type:complete len:265 (+) Transcript_54742:1245-2039(+)
MLQLQLTVLPELLLILEGHHAKGVPVAQGRAGTQLCGWVELREEALAIVEGRDVAGRQLLNWRLSCEAVLDQHACHSNHCQAAVVQLGCELQLALGWILDFPTPVAGAEVAGLRTVLGIAKAAEGLVLEELGLDQPCHQQDLQPALQRNLRHSCDARRHVGELQVLRWGQVAIELAEDIRPKQSERCNHAKPAVLQLHSTAAIKVLLGATVLAESHGIPKKERVACADLLGSIIGATDHRARGAAGGWARQRCGCHAHSAQAEA